MIKKIIAIKNVGRFRNSAAQGNPQLAKYTLIVGANSFGKTTVCAILRSLQIGDPAYVIGRKTLGATDVVTIELLLENNVQARFDGTAWTTTLPNLCIFDSTFVTENVHSGDVVEIDHKRNLYRVIIGEEGAHLVEEDTRLAAEGRAKTAEITAAAKALQPHSPAGMKQEDFLKLPADPDIDAKIAEQEKTLEAVRQAHQIQARPILAAMVPPALPGRMEALLSSTIDDIAKDAEEQLNRHLVDHQMIAGGEAWIAKGMGYIAGDNCPFCGQGLNGVSLIDAYRAVFSDAYKTLKAEVAACRTEIVQGFGDGGIGNLTTLIERNRGGVEFWYRYCSLDPATLAAPVDLADATHQAGLAAIALLDRKASAPLEALPLDEAFTTAKTIYDQICAAVATVNTAIKAANILITAKKAATGGADVKAAEAELSRLRAIQKRHQPAIAQACTDYAWLEDEKKAIEKAKDDIRAKLEEHTKRVVKPYEQRINALLDAFNAGFQIAETKHGYPGGIATSSYQLVVNNTPIEVGDGKTPPDRPSFKNTLSAGDRTTLALAFFLAHLERDARRAQKIVIFDDPFNSQDAFRRRQTIYEIAKTGRDCAQVIVLSHDASFLKQVWEKAPPAERIALQIVDARAQGSKIMLADLDKACQGRVASEIDDLLSFFSTGAGKALDIIKKMRVVLETHCRTTYFSCFEANDWLGDIVRKTREGGDQHPAWPLYDELDQINDYTKTYHHGEDVADATTDQIDANELTGFVRRTLKIVNALQA